MKRFNIAVLPGDGIGPEVMRASLAVLRAVESADLAFSFSEYPVGATHFRDTGEILPQRVVDECKRADAVFLSAIGLPDVRLADGTEVQPQIIVGLRKELDIYAAIRPIKLYPGVKSLLADVGKGINFVIVRENTEGLFASFNGGGSVKNEVATDTMVITRKGTERIARFAFALARERSGRPLDGRRVVTCVDKANVFRSLAFFRKVFDEVAGANQDIASEHALVDALSLHMVQNPSAFDVLVTENMFGDILSDLAAGLVGGLGLGPSAEIGDDHALFQPSHGSAPQLAGKNIANPMATILSGAMMVKWLGERHHHAAASLAARRIDAAVAWVIAEQKHLTPDLGGTSGTDAVADAVVAALARQNKMNMYEAAP
ncbi:MAG: isocitrate/isopropylmalate dehydrogenase family protein [Rubrivivax sp.]|nr:isocitrate/isopropylmalate dehydrogenase family protein [Rubrivivax sp.]MDP3611612.1 isocitrate/isopropylmalate dehydrogenase family protein [Rubrivivax sp.]